MKLSLETKNKIIELLNSPEFKSNLYDGLDEQTRTELGQFYTPAEVCIEMLEMYKTNTFSNKLILDPCCGSGNLLIAMLIAGADSDKIYGNDYDHRAVKLARKRVNRACDILGKPHIHWYQIHKGNALDSFCLSYFAPDYKDKIKQHYLESQYGLFPMLTSEQEEFIKEID